MDIQIGVPHPDGGFFVHDITGSLKRPTASEASLDSASAAKDQIAGLASQVVLV